MLKGNDKAFRCLFVDNSRYNEYLSATVYVSHPRVIMNRRIRISKLLNFLRNPEYSVDLCVAVLPHGCESSFQELYDFKGPQCVRQIIDTSGSWEEIKGRFNKTKKRFSNSMANRNLNHRISTDMKDFDFFYRRMYVPHAVKQFGNLAIIEPYEKLKQYFSKGLLLHVAIEGQAVASALCQVEHQTLIYRKAGVLDGNVDHIKTGAQMALYYYMLRFAKENNLGQLDMMTSSAFLNDGVYRHKRTWGAAVYPDNEAASLLYYFIPSFTEKVIRFFEQNPVIVETKQGLKGVVGLNNQEIPPKTKKYLFDQYFAPGLKGLIILSPHSNGFLDFSRNYFNEACNHN